MDLDDFFDEQKEKDRKVSPSKVFFNHFYAIAYCINANIEKFNLNKLSYFNTLKLNNPNFKLDNCRKLLWNSWSTEYAFNVKPQADNKEFYKFALHWHFPQAYYSIYLAMTAFHETQGISSDQHEKSIKNFGNSVKHNHYPAAISFYVSGLYKETQYYGLDCFTSFKKDFTALRRVTSIEESHEQIANFLKSTREKNAENKRKRGEKSHEKDVRFQTKNGLLTSKFSKKHWDIIYASIPETTILNIMYRLRIKANYHDIETFMNADIDFAKFHDCLSEIIYYLNYVHEAYIHKVIGDEKYSSILDGFNGGKSDFKAKTRYQTLINN